jgi:hypothetical protein
MRYINVGHENAVGNYNKHLCIVCGAEEDIANRRFPRTIYKQKDNDA